LRSIRRAGDSLATACLLSALHPTVFALSYNWYAISGRKVLWLLGASLAGGALVFVASALLRALLERLLKAIGVPAPDEWSRTAQAALVAVACVSTLFVLLYRVMLFTLPGRPAVTAAFALSVLGAAWLFVRRGQRYASGLLAVLTLVSAVTWLWNWAEIASRTPWTPLLAARRDFEDAKLLHRPNVYLLLYDAYGSRDVYQRVFAFDNSPHYAALEKRGFKIAHTFSNYSSTWPTVLGLFMGDHNYYGLTSGAADSKVGRPLMAGLGRNPLLETLRANGYRVQYIHGADYFVTEQGTLDFLFPQAPIHTAVRVYDSPLIRALAGREATGSPGIAAQTAVLLSRLADPPGADTPPWFTFAHLSLPAHSRRHSNWRQLRDFEQRFVERTRMANAHGLQVIDRIAAKDPTAIVVVFGDHGAWRYRDAWLLDDDPNESFRRAGLPPEIVALDLFGTMIAVRSDGRCDGFLDPSITPVNLMRAIFACLADDPGLLTRRAEDVSIFRSAYRLFLAARDGRALPHWEPIHIP
jgi:hypothetical protein